MDSKIISQLFIWCSLIAAGLFVMFPVQDFDTFWHVANGRWMVENGAVVNREVFSFTSPGVEFSNHAWLAQLLMYFSYEQWGANGLLGFKIALVALICLALLRMTQHQGLATAVALLLIFFMLYAALPRMVVRPLLFSMLGLALLGLILYGYRGGRYGPRSLYFLPLIMVLWDLLHGSIYGVIFLGAFVAGETLKLWLGPRLNSWPGMQSLAWDRLRNLWIWSGITLLAMLLNPYGLLSYDVILAFVGDNQMVAMTGEFLPITWADNPLIWCFIIAAGLSLIWHKRVVDITQILLFIPFAYLAIRYLRGIEALGPVGVMLLAASLAKLPPLKIAPKLKQAVPYLLLISVLAYSVPFKMTEGKFYRFGSGLSQQVFPTASLAFINESGLPANLYNSDRFGGYLAYFLDPQYKLFHYNHHTVFDALNEYVHNPETRAQWNVNFALVARDDEFNMFLNDGFVPVYREPVAAVMVRNNEQNRAFVEQHKLFHYQGSFDQARFDRAANHPSAYPVLIRELAGILKYRHDRPLAEYFATALLQTGTALGDPQKINYAQQALPHNGQVAELNASLGQLLLQQNQPQQALAYLDQAVQLEAAHYGARPSRAYLSVELGRYEEAEQDLLELLQHNPENANVIYGLAVSYSQQGNYPAARESLQRYLQLTPNGRWAGSVREMLDKIRNF